MRMHIKGHEVIIRGNDGSAYEGTIDGEEILSLYGDWAVTSNHEVVKDLGFWDVHWSLPKEERLPL